MSAFKTPYNRPVRLSNPYEHFPDEQLDKVLCTVDSVMDYDDYRIIFHLTPVGSYEELCYFLPLALRYIEQNPDDAMECLTEIIAFISGHADRLGADGLLDAIGGSLKACLASWSRGFVVQHYDRKACLRNGWSLDRCDIVKNSEPLIECLDKMADRECLAKIALSFLEEIGSSHIGIQCAWYLELCNLSRRYEGIYVHQPQLKNMLADKKQIDRCLGIIRKTRFVNSTYSPTYWEDISEVLLHD